MDAANTEYIIPSIKISNRFDRWFENVTHQDSHYGICMSHNAHLLWSTFLFGTGIFPGGKRGRCIWLTTYHLQCWLARNLGALTSWNPLGLSRPVMGLLYLYLLHHSFALHLVITPICEPVYLAVQDHMIHIFCAVGYYRKIFCNLHTCLYFRIPFFLQ
jgi:hypothetical protein